MYIQIYVYICIYIYIYIEREKERERYIERNFGRKEIKTRWLNFVT